MLYLIMVHLRMIITWSGLFITCWCLGIRSRKYQYVLQLVSIIFIAARLNVNFCLFNSICFFINKYLKCFHFNQKLTFVILSTATLFFFVTKFLHKIVVFRAVTLINILNCLSSFDMSFNLP